MNLPTSNITKARLSKVGKPDVRLDPLTKWNQSDKASKSLAIKAKCWDCSMGQIDEIKHCQVTSCPLHCIRPYQPKED
jgi:hypothetical protein